VAAALNAAVHGVHAPDEAALAACHHAAHEACYIADSITAEIGIGSPLADSH